MGLHLRLSRAPAVEVLARSDPKILAQLEFAAEENDRWEADIRDRGDMIVAVFANRKYKGAS